MSVEIPENMENSDFQNFFQSWASFPLKETTGEKSCLIPGEEMTHFPP